ncbi:PREDICTED: CUB and sushi domain-containing protein 1-like [Branchiostoma belcheri]|uniref:CUB and sushi domain-containing protein 1-like n=1 Tax=Branchiostoma belcheri TaxID=7741 RepID=A0A6P5ANX5_BRABE|nr:PREDICTED: CUB and sushi domain-containing protein 1-like [Branchiostoma belcheri]
MTSVHAILRIGTTLILATLLARAKGNVTPTSPTRCGGNFTAPSGGPITSPNYPDHYGNNENCEWLITVPAGNKILLTFDKGQYLEEDADFLFIYDGASDSALELQRITGLSSVIPVSSTSNTMFLRFTSDGELTRKGFTVTYTSQTPSVHNECGGYRSGQSSREILSPNHPGSYDNGLICTWTIVVNPRGYIRLKPKIFILEPQRDYLTVYDGDPEFNGKWLGSYAEFFLPDGVCMAPEVPKNGYRTGDNFAVGSVASFGCNDGLTLRGRQNTTCETAGVRGWDIYDLSSVNDLPKCKALCGGHITGRRFGVVYSPYYSERYDINMNCTWTIEVDSGRVKLTPEMFDLEMNHDYLTVYDGNGSVLGKYSAECGGYRTANVKSSGVLYSPNYPAPYGNNLNCTWTIATVNEGMGINMTIAEFSLQDRRDRLSIYAGDHISNYTLLGEYSGRIAA